MGDRRNVEVIDNGKSVFLYTHWQGTELPKIVQNALRRGKDRLDDGPYLTRIIFSEMIKDDILGTTGYGISAYGIESNHPNIVVNIEDQTIIVESMSWKMSLDDFIKQS